MECSGNARKIQDLWEIPHRTVESIYPAPSTAIVRYHSPSAYIPFHAPDAGTAYLQNNIEKNSQIPILNNH